MRLYLVRHGIAEDVNAVSSDRRRRLTDEGREELRGFAGLMERMEVAPSAIFSSPFLRAAETAEILRDKLAPGADVTPLECLEPGAKAEPLVAHLKECDANDVMVVGHAPDMSDIASAMLCPCGSVDVSFKKAAICGITFPEGIGLGAGVISLLLQPRHMRGLLNG